MVTIKSVKKGSAAFKAGIEPDDIIVSVNGNEINDGLDFYFHTADRELCFLIKRGDSELTVSLKTSPLRPLGIEFDTYLIDKQKSCRNKCIFCFIDQNPDGMRETIYFKDDDERMSFLHGNYVTLTNLKDKDIERIIKMHISPVNISVHTMNPRLRCEMMGNRFAGDCLRYMEELSAHGIEINAQLVLCPHINDGAELAYSLRKLWELESLKSVSCVPVGITAHRKGLYPLKPYDKEGALAVIDLVNSFGDKAAERCGARMFYASDEFYLTAELPIPEREYYDDYPQLDNGVGMLRSHRDEFLDELEYIKEEIKKADRRVSIATGLAAHGHIADLALEAEKAIKGLEVKVFPVKNDFFGETVTVSGLVTGGDLIKTLRGKDLGEELLIPCNMLRFERDLFLDGVSLKEAEEALGVPIRVVESGGDDLVRCILGIGEEIV